MKADITRSTFDPGKHFASVRQQQGRVPMDADWNEQADITAHTQETETRDVVGDCGMPRPADGFRLVASAADLTAAEQARPGNVSPPPLPLLQGASDFYITAGRAYVDGILCENERILPFSAQPDFPGAALPQQNTQPQEGTYLAYLDVWRRSITALEDPSIREVALGGPDTATRLKTVFQVKVFRLGPASLTSAEANCLTDSAEWNALIAAGTGRLAARAEPGAQSTDPCIVTPGAGYRRLENQLYRVEVHTGGSLGQATFKWSRDNGSIVARWESQDGASGERLTVSSAGRDRMLSFGSGQWVELIDDTAELLGNPGTLVRIAKVEGNVITVDPTTATGSIVQADFPRNPKVRRWDHTQLLEPSNSTTFHDLESGVQVRFQSGAFHTGDYWLIPARTNTADVEWPRDAANAPVAQLAHGIAHHYCRLAVMRFSGAAWISITDCRDLFPPLTETLGFFYLSGDGQEALPGQALPQPLRVGVALGRWPVAGKRVRFRRLGPGGELQAGSSPVETGSPQEFVVQTDAQGVAEVRWELDTDANQTSQRVEANLLDVAGQTVHLTIGFNAQLEEIGERGRCCAHSVGRRGEQVIGEFATIAEALKALADEETICLCLLPGNHEADDVDATVAATLKITGCGVATTLRVTRGFQLRARQLILRDLGVEAAASSAAVVRLEAEQIIVEGCLWQRTSSAPDAPPFVQLVAPERNTSEVQWCGNTMVATVVRREQPGGGLVAPGLPADIRDRLVALAELDPVLNEREHTRAVAELADMIAALPAETRLTWAESRSPGGRRRRPAAQRKAKAKVKPAERAVSITARASFDVANRITELGPIGTGGARLSRLSADEATDAFFAAVSMAHPNRAALVDALAELGRASITLNLGTALALQTNAVGGVVERNVILGVVALNQSQPIHLPELWSDALLNRAFSGRHTLLLARNRLGTLMTRIPREGALPGYASLMITDNVFIDQPSSLLSEAVSFSANHFINATDEDVLGFVLANGVTFLGNQSNARKARLRVFARDRADAANLLQFSS